MSYEGRNEYFKGEDIMFNKHGLVLILAIMGFTHTSARVHEIEAGNSGFSPSTVKILVGDSVRWTGTSAQPHAIQRTATPEPFQSNTLSMGASFTTVFNSAGSFTYSCSLHSSETGTVMVGGASSIHFNTPAGARERSIPVDPASSARRDPLGRVQDAVTLERGSSATPLLAPTK